MARRCFFSFHYQDVVDFRANVVRNHNIVKDNNGGYFDASLWESAQKTGDAELKRLINRGLENTTATVVLIGSQTYSRRWVQYEIVKSLERGNLLLGIHINGIADTQGRVLAFGQNPFDHLGLQISLDGRTGTPTIWNGQSWVWYPEIGAFPIPLQPPQMWGQHIQLSYRLPVYDWVAHDGYNNFATWIA